MVIETGTNRIGSPCALVVNGNLGRLLPFLRYRDGNSRNRHFTHPMHLTASLGLILWELTYEILYQKLVSWLPDRENCRYAPVFSTLLTQKPQMKLLISRVFNARQGVNTANLCTACTSLKSVFLRLTVTVWSLFMHVYTAICEKAIYGRRRVTQDHPMSSKLVPIESPYATSY